MAKTRLNKLISSVKKILSTGDPTDTNKLITTDDSVSSSELSTLIDTSSNNQRVVNVVSKSGLSDSDSKKLLTEEQKRRKIDDVRRLDVEQAQKDEMERRLLFDDKVQLMKDEYQLFLKKNYPNVVREKQIKDDDVSTLQTSISQRKTQIEVKETQLKDRIVQRLEREKRRKTQESKLTVNRVTTSQRFFESEIEMEYDEKLVNNPEIENLTDIQQTSNQISELERQLGRKIIPHRDMMETPNGIVLIKERIAPNS